MYGHPLSQPLSYKRFEFDEYLSMFIFDFIINYDKERRYWLCINE